MKQFRRSWPKHSACPPCYQKQARHAENWAYVWLILARHQHKRHAAQCWEIWALKSTRRFCTRCEMLDTYRAANVIVSSAAAVALCVCVCARWAERQRNVCINELNTDSNAYIRKRHDGFVARTRCRVSFRGWRTVIWDLSCVRWWRVGVCCASWSQVRYRLAHTGASSLTEARRRVTRMWLCSDCIMNRYQAKISAWLMVLNHDVLDCRVTHLPELLNDTITAKVRSVSRRRWDSESPTNHERSLAELYRLNWTEIYYLVF